MIAKGAVAAGLPIPLLAVTMQPLTLVAPSAAVPLIWVPVNVKLAGNVQPESASVGTGTPVTVKLPEPGVPTVNVEFEIAEMVGA